MEKNCNYQCSLVNGNVALTGNEFEDISSAIFHEELSGAEYERFFAEELERYRATIHYEEKRGFELFRRIVDIIFSLIVILPVTVLILIFAVIICLDSPGSPIFSQVRVGRNGKLIKIHKLRSMKKEAEAGGQKWAEDNDPRVTRIGKILRKYRIDEIPQFFDVLTGNLSLIGPRPEVPSLTKRFNEETPGFVTRLLVAPGLSGWAQVNGGYNITAEEKWEKDNYYIENRGFRMYVKIFLRTLGVVARGEDAK